MSVAAETDRGVERKAEIYQEIVQLNNMKHLAKTQAEELALLREQLEVSRMKNFPSLN